MPCVGTVRVWLDQRGRPVRYRLLCDGDCPRSQTCKKRSSRDHHGSVREWCGCTDTEPTDCHVVLYTIGRGENRARAGQKEILCAGGCESDDVACQLVIVNERDVVIQEPGGPYLPQGRPLRRGKVIDVRCECL